MKYQQNITLAIYIPYLGRNPRLIAMFNKPCLQWPEKIQSKPELNQKLKKLGVLAESIIKYSLLLARIFPFLKLFYHQFTYFVLVFCVKSVEFSHSICKI